ncbi:MAG: YjbQ family protein [Clostridiaceae bacterium]|nr:YjbQ family protein [Clostridiaceae bacterium]
MKAQSFTIETGREGYYNITSTIRRMISESGVQSGICVVFCPHTTGAITINENADPDVQHDLILGFDEAFPSRRAFRHMEGNSDAHLKCSTVGASETILIEDGKPLLGTWQGVYFCEFDGPRTRKYYVKIMPDSGC